MKDFKDLISDFDKANAEWKDFDQNKKARAAAAVCTKVIKENITKQGFDSDSGVEGWQPRKDSTNNSYDKRYGVKGSTYNSSNPLLMQTRKLFNSIRSSVINKDKIFCGVDLNKVPYAQFVNETRKYLDYSKKIPTEIKKDYYKKINKIMDKFK